MSTNLSTTNCAFHTQYERKEEIPSLNQKGQFVALGSTSFVELLPNGDIIKTAWPGIDRAAERRSEIATEAKVYDRLGTHHRLVKKKAWDPDSHTLTLEYMPKGTLKEYLESHKDVTLEQRREWVAEAAPCIQLLHHLGVIHCDIGPHNFVLDGLLGLRIIDFSGSSIDNSRTETCPGVRYTAPDSSRSSLPLPTIKTDLFSLGSTIYYIMTGKAPFQEFESEEVVKRYLAHDFPDLNGIPHADIIQRCWLQKFQAVDELIELLRT